MKTHITYRSLWFVLLPTVCVLAQDPGNQRSGGEVSRVGTSSAQFLKIGVGARSAALGEALVSVSGDLSSLYWNPSGIASLKRNAAMASRIDFLADVEHNFFGFVHPLSSTSALGLSLTSLSSGNIEVTTIAEPNGTGTYYDVTNFTVGLTYARFVTDRLLLGLTVKAVHESIFRESATSVAFDVGSILDTGLLGIKLGMALTNFGADMRMKGPDLERGFIDPDNPQTPSVDTELQTEGWPLPLSFRLGLSTDLIGEKGQIAATKNNRMTVFADFVDSNDALLRGNVGAEYALYNIVFLRGGYHGLAMTSDIAQANFNFSTYETASYTYGGGLRYDFGWGLVTADYALSNYGRLEDTHIFTLALGF